MPTRYSPLTTHVSRKRPLATFPFTTRLSRKRPLAIYHLPLAVLPTRLSTLAFFPRKHQRTSIQHYSCSSPNLSFHQSKHFSFYFLFGGFISFAYCSHNRCTHFGHHCPVVVNGAAVHFYRHFFFAYIFKTSLSQIYFSLNRVLHNETYPVLPVQAVAVQYFY